MSNAPRVALLIALLVPARATTQELGNLKIFGTLSYIAGASRVLAPSGLHTAPYGGVRGELGIEIRRLGIGIGGRIWDMARTEEFGGTGIDMLFVSEWRLGAGGRTNLRGAWGLAYDEFDSGSGPKRPKISTEGNVWSVGVGHQVIARSNIGLLLSADFVVPPAPIAMGRRRPALEFGVGIHYTALQPISLLP